MTTKKWQDILKNDKSNEEFISKLNIIESEEKEIKLDDENSIILNKKYNHSVLNR